MKKNNCEEEKQLFLYARGFIKFGSIQEKVLMKKVESFTDYENIKNKNEIVGGKYYNENVVMNSKITGVGICLE